MVYPYEQSGYDPTQYRTRFLALAVLLKYAGHELTGYEHPKPGGSYKPYVQFIFRKTPELEQDVEKYFAISREMNDIVHGQGPAALDYDHVLVADFFHRSPEEARAGARANGVVIENLRDAGIHTIGQLMNRKYSEVSTIKGIGPSGLALIQERLSKKGLYLSR